MRSLKMKKVFTVIIISASLFTSHAFGACTIEQFQEKLLTVQKAMTDYADNMPSRLVSLNDEMEDVFRQELDAMKDLPAEIGQTPEGQRKVLDMGCELYDKMTVWIRNHE